LTPYRTASALPLSIAYGKEKRPITKNLANEKFLSFSLALIQITLRMNSDGQLATRAVVARR
jgi:hypothetical protein